MEIYSKYSDHNSGKLKIAIAGIIVIIIMIIASISIYIYSSFNDTEYTVTVVDKERVNYSDSSKYLIYCEDESGNNIVFENTDNMLRGKFNSSEVYMDLEIGKTYTVTVIGFRIPFFSMYQNIIELSEVK